MSSNNVEMTLTITLAMYLAHEVNLTINIKYFNITLNTLL